MKNFADRLAEAVTRCGNGVLVGLDPRWEQLPPGLTTGVAARDFVGMANAYAKFCCGIVDAVAPLVPAVKPQAAFFEQLGPPGMTALGRVIEHAKCAGLLIIVDGKRNDIGTTAAAYADAYLGEQSAWGADALTVSPYLGDDSLEPFVKIASDCGAGIFVLVKTSNPGSGTFQNRVSDDGKPIYRHVAALVEQLAANTAGECGYGIVGAVVGATYPEQLVELRAAMPHVWILAPGFGSQGGAAKDVAPAFDERGLGGLVNNSRGINFAFASKEYGQRFGPSRWHEAAEAATRDMIEQLAAARR